MTSSTQTSLTPSAIAALLDRLVEWGSHIEARLGSQLTFLEVLEEHIGVELRTYYSGPIDPRFVQDMLDAALQRHATQQALAYDPAEHAPYRWEEQEVQEIPEERREIMVQLVESIGSRLLDLYQDYLRRHWGSTPQDIVEPEAFRAQCDAWVAAHLLALEQALAPDALVDKDVDNVRALIEELQLAWHEQPALLALATTQEQAAVNRLMNTQLPDWFKLLDADARTRLQEALALARDAQERVRRLLSAVATLEAHAREQCADYLRTHLDNQLSPDLIELELVEKADADGPRVKLTLSALAAGGAQDLNQIYTLVSTRSAVLLNTPPSPEQIHSLLYATDSRASYLPALLARHEDVEVRQALIDAADLELRYSLLRGGFAGHLSEAEQAQVLQTLAGEPGALPVYAVQLFDAALCSDLLVFVGQNDEGESVPALMYAPGKPDGQEWVVVRSVRDLNQEVGGWFATSAGREYLRAQLPFEQREAAEQSMHQVVQRPGAWSLALDRLTLPGDYPSALQRTVLARLAAQRAEVEKHLSPGWYTALAIEEQRALGLLNEQARLAERAFQATLTDYQSFHVYARKAIAEAITPYLVSRGVLEAVDPETIIIDSAPGLADGPSEPLNLVDLVCYGYDDNAGIDHPQRGVRSLVGQDLSALRSADLAQYARRAYLGEQYIAHIRATYLDPADARYRSNQQRFARAMLTGMDRDLRVALGSAQIDLPTYEALSALVSGLAATVGQDAVTSSSEAVLAQPGVLRLTLDGVPILGAYVFRLLRSGVAEDWLYTSDAPDDRVLRPYHELGATVGGALHDYVLLRAGLAQRSRAEAHLQALASGNAHRDALREANQVLAVAGEYDRFIEHALTDVDDATHSRAEVIRGQVVKGLLYAAPLTLVYPPFAALIGAWFVVAPLRAAVIAHTRGDTARALQEWLAVAWGTLGLVAHLPGVSIRAVRALLGDARRLLVRQRAPISESIRVPAMRFDRRWAVREAPGSLHKAGDEGIWAGTFRTDEAADAAGVQHFIRYRGRYYQVEHDTVHDTLRVLKANNPHSYHREAVVRAADGRWLANSTGLRGGSPARDVGRISSGREVSAGAGNPDNQRGALQGEAVVASFSAQASDHYLFTLNAQTCVAVSLYNPATKAGAVIHFDHNIKPLIEQSVRAVLARIRAGGSDKVNAVMAGGDWLGGRDIGGPVRAVLRQNGIRPTWDHWSYSSCFGNTYGMTLDLRSGVTRVYTMNGNLVDNLLTPLLREAQRGSAGPLFDRARRFMDRVRSEPLYQGSDGVIRDGAGRAVNASGYQHHAIGLTDLGTG